MHAPRTHTPSKKKLKNPLPHPHTQEFFPKKKQTWLKNVPFIWSVNTFFHQAIQNSREMPFSYHYNDSLVGFLVCLSQHIWTSNFSCFLSAFLSLAFSYFFSMEISDSVFFFFRPLSLRHTLFTEILRLLIEI